MKWNRRSALVALVASFAAHATVVLQLTFEEMASRSVAVVRGIVGAQESHWDAAHRRIFTYAEIRVDEPLKGRVAPVILVRSPGGEAEGVGQRVEGTPHFTAGESVLLFLEAAPDEPAVHQVMALSAGKISLAPSKTGELRATRDLTGITQYALGSIDRQPRLELRTVEDLGSAEAFVSRIRKAIRAGAAR